MTNHTHPIRLFTIFLKLGLTSFGGPVAHLGYFRDELIERRKWLSEAAYADLVALCQFLPGPASSQVGMSLGLLRGGFLGGLLAWIGFTMPSAIALVLFALGLSTWGETLPEGLLHGLKVAAVAVVAKAVWGMATKLCTTRLRITIAVITACVVLLWPTAGGQVAVIGVAALAGLLLFRGETDVGEHALTAPLGKGVAVTALTLFFALLVGLPLLAQLYPNQTLDMVDVFYRAGSLVFGGGHVVLPLLQAEVVPSGWVSDDVFLAGYGAAQAVPGPLFTFSAFLGAASSQEPNAWLGGLICLLAIYLPSFLLVAGALPFWAQLSRNVKARAALSGVNAAVVGLLLAALYQPVWLSAILVPQDFALAILAFTALSFWRTPPWLVVLLCGLAGVGLAAVGG